MDEVDIYNHIPYPKQKKWNERNHRLTLWKNLKTNEYELIKVFTNAKIGSFGKTGTPLGGIIITHKESGEIEIYKKSKTLHEILNQATIMSHKFWETNEEFVECEHKSMISSISCGKKGGN